MKAAAYKTMLHTAQQGVAAGFNQASDAAAEIERATRPVAKDTVEISERAQIVKQGVSKSSALMEGLVNLSRARAAVMANLASFRTADSLSRTALSIGKKS